MPKPKSPKNVFLEPILILLACVAVAVLAARGTFLSMTGFPWIFGAVCVAVGAVSLLRPPRVAIAGRTAVLLVAGFTAFAGWTAQNALAAEQREESRQAALAALEGMPAPSLKSLEPLNVEPETLTEAASYTARATIVTFWARWCSPCWTELPELNEFHQQHKDDGLAVVAVTKYDRHEGEAARADEFDKAVEFVEEYGLTFPAGIAPDGSVHRAFHVTSLPSVALVDASGTVVGFGVGVEGGRAIMEQALTLLGE